MPSEHAAGTWHLPGPERLSRSEIAHRVVAALGLPGDSIAAEPTPPGAERPRDLHLRDDRARREIGWSPTPILGEVAAG
jgi:dTDP-4-dehydrorhamnose reductase